MNVPLSPASPRLQLTAYAAVAFAFFAIITWDSSVKLHAHRTSTVPFLVVVALAILCAVSAIASVCRALSPVQRAAYLRLSGRWAFLAAATVANFALLMGTLWNPLSSGQTACSLLSVAVGAYVLSAAWADLLERWIGAGKGEGG